MKTKIWEDEANKMCDDIINRFKVPPLNCQTMPVYLDDRTPIDKLKTHKKLMELIQKGYVFWPRGGGKNWLYKNCFNKPQKEGNMFGPIVPSVGPSLDWAYDIKKHQEVKITKAHNGWIVKVGCATFVETDWNKICKGLKEYWDDPVKAEKKYYKK
jgi:hypothetical protein